MALGAIFGQQCLQIIQMWAHISSHSVRSRYNGFSNSAFSQGFCLLGTGHSAETDLSAAQNSA